MDGRKIKVGVSRIFFVMIALIMVISAMFVAENNFKNKVAKTPSLKELKSKTYEQLDEEKQWDSDHKIKFGAYFAMDTDGNGKAERLLGTCNEEKAKDTLYLEVDVGSDGHLENGQIIIGGVNFQLAMNMFKGGILKNDYISNNVEKIELNTINPGQSEIITGSISSKISGANYFSKDNKITLKGTYVPNDEEGQSEEISRELTLKVDWYGSARTDLSCTTAVREFTLTGDDE